MREYFFYVALPKAITIIVVYLGAIYVF